MSWAVIGEYLPFFARGALTTAWLACGTFVASCILAAALVALRTSTARLVRVPIGVLLEAVRAVPILMVIFWTYFMIPALFDVTMPPVGAGFLALTIANTPYVVEIMRGGLAAVAEGQREAARASGLTHWQALRFVLLPQALRKMLPPMMNQFVSNLKATSLLFVIGVTEFFRAATLANNREFRSFEIFAFVAVVYLVFCGALSVAARLLEARVGRTEARTAAT